MYCLTKLIAVPLLLVILNSVISVNGFKAYACCEEYCYESDDVRPQIEYFSSKTSYYIEKRKHSGNQFNVPSKFKFFSFCCCFIST